MILFTTTEPVHLILEVTCELDCTIIYTVVHEKQNTKLLSITLPNNDQFSKFFHYYTQREICNKDIITDLATP